MSEEKQLTVDLDELLGAAAREAGPGEDFDEALLRVVKQRFPEGHTSVFAAVSSMVEMKVKESGLAPLEAAREVARGQAQLTINQVSSVTTRHFGLGEDPSAALESLPPEIREKLQEAMRTGQVGGDREVVVVRRGGPSVTLRGGNRDSDGEPRVIVSKGCLGVVVLLIALAGAMVLALAQ